MNRDTLKYIGLGLIAVALLALNVNMVYKMFFAKNRLNPDYKKPVEITNDDIRRYADSLFTQFGNKSASGGKDSLTIVDNVIESNKRIIMNKKDTIGFCYIVYEPIPCSSCSDINYILMVNKTYTINKMFFLRNIVEGNKIVPFDSLANYIASFINKSLITGDFSKIQTLGIFKKNTEYLKKSIIKLQKQAQLFYEK